MSKAVVQIGWADVPWLDAKAKEEVLKGTPPHLRDARSKGIPLLGDGNVYQVPLEDFIVKPFPIPKYFKLAYGLDVGYNNTAVIAGALDPQTDILYLYSEHMTQGTPDKTAPFIWGLERQAGYPLVGLIDPSARNRAATDGQKVIAQYRALKCKIIPAENAVEAGIFECTSRLQSGRLKVFSTLPGWQNEYMVYHRKDGKIVKHNDHRMDAWRYLVMGLRYAKPAPVGSGNSGGYSGRKYF